MNNTLNVIKLNKHKISKKKKAIFKYIQTDRLNKEKEKTENISEHWKLDNDNNHKQFDNNNLDLNLCGKSINRYYMYNSNAFITDDKHVRNLINSNIRNHSTSTKDTLSKLDIVNVNTFTYKNSDFNLNLNYIQNLDKYLIIKDQISNDKDTNANDQIKIQPSYRLKNSSFNRTHSAQTNSFMCIRPIKPFKNGHRPNPEFDVNKKIKYFKCFPYHDLIDPDLMQEMFVNLIKEEKHFSEIFDFKNTSRIQTDINEKMRAILIDWLIDVNEKFKLQGNTLFLTVKIIDCYLSKKFINQNKLQLLGVTALWVSSKYEEISCPLLKDCVYITANAYTEQQIIEMEQEILSTLSYVLTFPTVINFYDLLAVNFGFAEVEYYLGRFWIELYLLDRNVNFYNPSLVACSAIYLVMKFYKDSFSYYSWIYYYTLDDEKTLKLCANRICYLMQNLDSSCFVSVKMKYSEKKYLEVASINILSEETFK